jgi:hypothetical protein
MVVPGAPGPTEQNKHGVTCMMQLIRYCNGITRRERNGIIITRGELRRLARPRSCFATIMSSVDVPTNSEPETNVASDIDEEEPQNPLTQKFTDKEWAALKEFRVRAPPIHPYVASLTHYCVRF